MTIIKAASENLQLFLLLFYLFILKIFSILSEMSKALTKIEVDDIKKMVCEALMQLNELSSKDWHDKFLSQIPEELFYRVMGRDKKKTPLKEFMFKAYLAELGNKGEAQSRQLLLNVADIYNSFDGAQTQEANALVQKYNSDSLADLLSIMQYVLSKKRDDSNFNEGIGMYAEDCVRIYEDEEWLVICPLTPEASRKNCNNGNHWCTCSSTYLEYFPTYTYKADSCIVAFLNKKSPINSIQAQFNSSNPLVVACDYSDGVIEKSNVPNCCSVYEIVLNKLRQNKLLDKLITETRERSQGQSNYIPSPSQLVTMAVNWLKEYNVNDIVEGPNRGSVSDEDEGIVISNIIAFNEEGTSYFCKVKYYINGDIYDYWGKCVFVGFFHSDKTGNVILSTDDNYFSLLNQFYYLPKSVSDMCDYCPFGYTQNSVICYSKTTDSIKYLFGDRCVCARTEPKIVFCYAEPLLVLADENYNNLLFRFNGEPVDETTKCSKSVILPASWGGQTFNITVKLNNCSGNVGNIEYHTIGCFLFLKNRDNNDYALYGMPKECLGVFHNCNIIQEYTLYSGLNGVVMGRSKEIDVPEKNIKLYVVVSVDIHPGGCQVNSVCAQIINLNGNYQTLPGRGVDALNALKNGYHYDFNKEVFECSDERYGVNAKIDKIIRNPHSLAN